MKTYIKNLFLLPALAACLGLMPVGKVQAQTFTLLHSFTAASDGGRSVAELTLSGDTLYGTAQSGGNSGGGTVFSVKTNGTGFTLLHIFTATVNDGSGNLTNSDGSLPYAGLILSGDTLYGTASGGGSSGSGTVFSIKTNGTGFTILHSFTNGDGSHSQGTLLLSGNTLYGTTERGGTSNFGTVFKVDTDGNNFTTLHSFSQNGSGGLQPYAGLLLIGNTLYGTTFLGTVVIDSSLSSGTVFAVDTNGNNFMTLHSFPNLSYPSCRLVSLGNTLYGTTFRGGGLGTVFAIDTSGNNFTTLHTFIGGSDGDSPYAGLIVSGNTLYGTTSCTGSGGSGTVFSMKPDGNNFTTLFSFSSGNSGQSPYAEVILSGSTLYGTALNGGSGSSGTVFSLTLPCASADMNIALYAGVSISGSLGCTYEIDYTTNLNNPTWIPMTTNTLLSNPYLFIDTNAIAGSRFYRAVTQ